MGFFFNFMVNALAVASLQQQTSAREESSTGTFDAAKSQAPISFDRLPSLVNEKHSYLSIANSHKNQVTPHLAEEGVWIGGQNDLNAKDNIEEKEADNFGKRDDKAGQPNPALFSKSHASTSTHKSHSQKPVPKNCKYTSESHTKHKRFGAGPPHSSKKQPGIDECDTFVARASTETIGTSVSYSYETLLYDDVPTETTTQTLTATSHGKVSKTTLTITHGTPRVDSTVGKRDLEPTVSSKSTTTQGDHSTGHESKPARQGSKTGFWSSMDIWIGSVFGQHSKHSKHTMYTRHSKRLDDEISSTVGSALMPGMTTAFATTDTDTSVKTGLATLTDITTDNAKDVALDDTSNSQEDNVMPSDESTSVENPTVSTQSEAEPVLVYKSTLTSSILSSMMDNTTLVPSSEPTIASDGPNTDADPALVRRRSHPIYHVECRGDNPSTYTRTCSHKHLGTTVDMHLNGTTCQDICHCDHRGCVMCDYKKAQAKECTEDVVTSTCRTDQGGWACRCWNSDTGTMAGISPDLCLGDLDVGWTMMHVWNEDGQV